MVMFKSFGVVLGLGLASAGWGAVFAGAQPAGGPGAAPSPKPGTTVIEGGRPRVPEGVRAIYDIPYVQNGHALQKLDVYLPEKPSPTPLPVIVWVHSGNWKMGDKQACQAMAWASRGFAAASINYRLTPEVGYREIVADVKASIRFLRSRAKEYNFDPSRFGIWGVSAGGHLAALTAVTAGDKSFEGELGNAEQSSAVQAAAVWFGHMDLTKFNAADRHAEDIEALVGGSLSNKQADLRAASPITHVDKSDPAFMFMHGAKNDQVPPAQTELMVNALKAAGVEATAFLLPEQGHGFRPKQVFDQQVARVEAWFREKFGMPASPVGATADAPRPDGAK